MIYVLSFYHLRVTIARGLLLQENLDGNLDLRGLTSATRLTLPQSIGGNQCRTAACGDKAVDVRWAWVLGAVRPRRDQVLANEPPAVRQRIFRRDEGRAATAGEVYPPGAYSQTAPLGYSPSHPSRLQTSLQRSSVADTLPRRQSARDAGWCQCHRSIGAAPG